MGIRPRVRVSGPAAPFAPSSYARLRLLRRLHASGLLRDADRDGHEDLQDDLEGDTPAGRRQDDRRGSGGC